jgi:hypothetical protein
MTPAEICECHSRELENVMAEIFYGAENPTPLVGDKVVFDGGADHIVYTVQKLHFPYRMPATARREDFMFKAAITAPSTQVDYPAVKIAGAGKVRIVGADRLSPFDGDKQKLVEEP